MGSSGGSGILTVVVRVTAIWRRQRSKAVVAAVVAALRWWKLCAVDQLCDGRQYRWRCHWEQEMDVDL